MGVATMRVPTIFTAVDRFSSIVDKMTRKTTMFGSAASAAAMRTSRKFNDAGTSLLTTGVVMGAGIGIAVNEAVKFEKAMGNVSTTIDSTPELMRKMGDEVLAMSKKIPIPLEQMTAALYDVVSAGIDAKHSMTVLKASGRLATAGLGTAAEGVDILTSSINSFNMDASKSEQIANMVFKAVKYGKTTVEGLAESFGNSTALIKNSNIELSEFLASTATLTTTGMSASRAQTQIASATIALIKPNKTMSKVFNKLGASDIPKYIKQNGGLIKTLKLVVDQANEMGINLPAAFGRKEGLNATLSLLGSLRGKFDEINNDMIKGTDTLSESFNKQTATTAARYQMLKNNLVDLAIKIGNAVLPALNSLMGVVLPIIEKWTAWAKRNEGLAKAILYTTVVLLALGVAAKVAGAVFYGYGVILKTITFLQAAYTTITQLCTVATYLAAAGQQTFAMSLWAVASGMFAAYAPVIAIVAALGLLSYAVFSTTDATDGYVSTQVSGLNKTNMAWKNSTSVMKGELSKQKGALASATQVNPSNSKPKNFSDLNNFGTTMAAKYKQAALENSASKGSKYSPEALKYAVRTGGFEFKDPAFQKYNTGNVGTENNAPQNIAGRQDMSKALEQWKTQQGGNININIADKNNNVDSVENDNPKGITVKTSSTKKP